jgi:hypothetical protein
MMGDIYNAARQRLPAAVQKGFHPSALVLLAHNQPAVFGGPLCHQGLPVREFANAPSHGWGGKGWNCHLKSRCRGVCRL